MKNLSIGLKSKSFGDIMVSMKKKLIIFSANSLPAIYGHQNFIGHFCLFWPDLDTIGNPGSKYLFE